MNKYEILKTEHLAARRSKDTIASNLYGTFKGEVESILKVTDTPENEVVESVAKKFIKNLETMNTETSKIEISLLKPYAPETMSDDDIIAELDTLDLDESMNFGQKMGMAMKAIGGRADGSDVKRIVMKYYN